MSRIWQDLRHGIRTFRRNKTLITVAVLSLAIGIGANTSVFSAVDVLILRPLPYPEPHNLNTIWTSNRDRGWNRALFSAPDFLDLREGCRTMEVAAFQPGNFILSSNLEAERLRGFYVTPGFLRILGTEPALGRSFLQEEGTGGHNEVAIISYGLWQRRFGGDPGLIGSSILLGSVPHTVVGIMSPDFWFQYSGRDIWVPLSLQAGANRQSHSLFVLSRVSEGFSREQASAEAQGVMGRIGQAHPETSAGHSALMVDLEEFVFDTRYTAGALIATVSVGLVLLIACANVANLLLVLAVGRDREMSLRGALGAGRGRIARQVLTEASMVALFGGGLGVVFSLFGIRGLRAIMPPGFPRVDEITLSPRVLAYAAVVSIITCLLFGLAPALQSSRTAHSGILKGSGRGGLDARKRRLRNGLVVGEVALAVVLMVSSVLLIQGFARVRKADLGFDQSDVLTMQTLLPEARYPDQAARTVLFNTLQDRLEALPGVERVSGGSSLPLLGFSSTYLVLGGEDFQDPDLRRVVGFKHVLPGYFDALDIPVARGRGIEDQDRSDSNPVVVVNQALAHQLWPEAEPLGQQVVLPSGPREVVGVVGDTRDSGAGVAVPGQLFLPVLQSDLASLSWTIEASLPLATLVTPVRDEVRAVDPSIPAYNLMPLDDLMGLSIAGDFIMVKVMSVLTAIALLLALGGIYGIVTHTVSQRTPELGIRMALGAQRQAVMSMVFRQGLSLTSIGVLSGTGAALLVTRGLSRFLFGVSPYDATTYGLVAVLFLLFGACAAIPPTFRATRVDPVVALRAE